MTRLIKRIEGKWIDAVTGERIWNSMPNDGTIHGEGTSATLEVADHNGREIIRRYEHQAWPGGMGQLLGVTETMPGRYAPVIAMYYSGS